jgi:ankyrin repeat protein
MYASGASGNGDLHIVQALLARRAEVNAKDNVGMTALIYASRYGRFDIVQALLANGAEVNASADGMTALVAATEAKHAGVRALLLQAGAKP